MWFWCWCSPQLKDFLLQMLNVIFSILMVSCFALPCVAFIFFCVFSCCLLSGFPFLCEIARQRVVKLTWVLTVFTVGRIVRGLMLYFFYIDASWTAQVDIAESSAILIFSLLIAEVRYIVGMGMEWLMLMKWSSTGCAVCIDSRLELGCPFHYAWPWKLWSLTRSIWFTPSCQWGMFATFASGPSSAASDC